MFERATYSYVYFPADYNQEYEKKQTISCRHLL